MWRTAGARFNAARRLKRRDWLSTISIAMFSIIGIFLPMMQRIYGFSAGSPIDNYYTALALSLSLFVLVISLVEGSENYRVRADRLQRNAEELTELRRSLEQKLARAKDTGQMSDEEVGTFRDQYEKVVQECPHNHDPIDDELFLVTHRLSTEFSVNGKPRIGWVEAQCRQFWYWCRVAGFLILGWAVVGFALAAYIRIVAD